MIIQGEIEKDDKRLQKKIQTLYMVPKPRFKQVLAKHNTLSFKLINLLRY